MTERLRNMSHENWDYFGDPRVGIPSEDIPEGSIAYDLAQEFPGELIRILIVFQSGTVAFEEDGAYETPDVPVLVILTPFISGVAIANRQYVIGPVPPVVDTGRKQYMSAGV